MPGFDDLTLGSQRVATLNGGLKMELGHIDVSNDISVTTAVPTTFVKLLGWIGHVSCLPAALCVSAGFGKPITNMSICTGPMLDISASDVTDIVTANARMTYIAWGW